MDRRRFMTVCGAMAAAAGMSTLPPAHAGPAVDYARVKLLDGTGQTLKASTLDSTEAYVFNYPYAAVPCFLISLPDAAPDGAALTTAAGEAYEFLGGVGPNLNLVAYVAICTHQLAYAKRQSSVLSYVAGPSEVAGRSGVVVCCAHDTVFDPSAGARVLTGKAPEPLPAVRLEYDAEDDALYATGLYGPDLIARFFKAFRAKLNQEYGVGKYRAEVLDGAPAVPLSQYAKDAESC